MGDEIQKVEDFSSSELSRFAMDLVHRTLIHHVFWFKEVEHQMGFEKALEMMDGAYQKSWDNQLTRLGKLFGFQMTEGIPQPLLEMDREKMMELIKALGVNWLAADGIWFQEVEFKYGMADAKRCNESCWAWFSPFEAWSIKRILGMPEQPGLAGLKRALDFRLYAGISTQTIVEESPNSLIFQMNECRVQSTRKRKGLEDYHCKSSGTVEHTKFASAIDSRIKTECIACPPDKHPDEWYCAWRFSIE